jgi:hypothetical protein
MKVFISHSARDNELALGLAQQFQESNHEAFSTSELMPGSSIFSEISSAIRSADILVALVTERNPNVFYELGLTAGASVPILLAARAGEVIPSDLASVLYIQLTGDASRDVQNIVRRTEEIGRVARRSPTRFRSAEAALEAAVHHPATLDALSPPDFEKLVAGLLTERGYEVSSPGPDAGADFVIKTKDDSVILVELKKLSSNSRVSAAAVARLLTAVSLAGASAGLLVSGSGFTTAAVALAAGTPIILRTLEDILNARSKDELLESDKLQ